MEKDAFLDSVFAETDALYAQNDLEGVLRVTGEAVAKANEQLRTAAPDSEEAIAAANRALILTDLHCNALSQAGENKEVTATYTGILIYILTLKVNPEKLPVPYMGTLLHIVNSLSMLMQDSLGDSFAMDHITAAFYETAALTEATYRHLGKKANFGTFTKEITLIGILLKDSQEEARLLNGQPITYKMAMDVLYDVLARLHSCGFINIGDF